MKRGILLAIAILVVIAATMTLVARPKEPEWTTSSPEALTEFQAGLDAQYKLYYDEAAAHFRKAFEHDPEFVVAKLFHSDHLRKDQWEHAEELVKEVLEADIWKLTPRERYMVERVRALVEERSGDALRLLDEYLKEYPNDPYVLNEQANRAWNRGEFEDAECLYQRLVEISPNWVIAYNQLGYITMAQGRFVESEEYFKSYRFIAPDQANPHDSLGELYITLGRYEEAEESLEKAIAVKPDFWAPYEHLALIRNYTDDLDGFGEVIDRAKAAGAPEGVMFGLECRAHYAEIRLEKAWQRALDELDSECVQQLKEGYAVVVSHLAACRLGEWDVAEDFENQASEILKKVEGASDKTSVKKIKGVLNHMQGVRLAIQGDLLGAEEYLLMADDGLTFTEAGIGAYKLYNRMILVEVLLAEGKDAQAHRYLAKVRGVNPMMVAEFEDEGLKILGLGRG